MTQRHQSFESLKKHTEAGQEFWSARDLANILEYRDWRNFLKVIDKAMHSCIGSGQSSADHFVEATKMVTLGSGSQRELDDFQLSRYACYLVVQNGDPTKPVIAAGQTKPTMKWAKKFAKPLWNWAVPCQKTCLRQRKASSN